MRHFLLTTGAEVQGFVSSDVVPDIPHIEMPLSILEFHARARGYGFDGANWVSTPASVAQAKANIVAKIKAKRDEMYAIGVQVAGDSYHSDLASRQLYMEKLQFPETLEAGGDWKTRDGVYVSMTVGLMQQVAAAVTAHYSSCFKACELHIQTMQQAPDFARYQFNDGWPA